MKKEIKKPLPNNVKNTKTKTFAKRLLLGLFLFWTIGSIIALSCLIWLCADKHKNDTAMITASAEVASTGGTGTSVSLTQNRSVYLYDVTKTSVYSMYEDITVTIAPLAGRSVHIGGDYLHFEYGTSSTPQFAEVTFFDVSNSGPYDYITDTYDCYFWWGDNNYALLDSNYYLREVLYDTGYVEYPDHARVSFTFIFESLDGESSTITTSLYMANEEWSTYTPGLIVQSVGYDDAYVNNLRAQIIDLNYQISQLNNRITTLLIDLEASESLRQSEVAELNEEITTLRNASLNLQDIISQKNEEIEELEAEIREITAGKNKIYQNGYDTGFADGATAGAADAYNQGYAAAVADGHGGGNFRSMIGALIDVPVNAITSLLDWNLLGINLKEFFFSILSVIVVVKIAMLFMR